MENIKAKDYLMEYIGAIKRQQRLEDEIATLEATKDSITKATDSINVQTSGFNEKLVEIDSKIDKKILTLMDERNLTIDLATGIMCNIRSISDSRYVDVLWKRYIELDYDPFSRDAYRRTAKLKRFEQIALEIGYNYDWTIHLHGLALIEMQKILDKSA